MLVFVLLFIFFIASTEPVYFNFLSFIILPILYAFIINLFIFDFIYFFSTFYFLTMVVSKIESVLVGFVLMAVK